MAPARRLLLLSLLIARASAHAAATEALLEAARAGSVGGVRAALEGGAEIDARGGGGQTALMSACLLGHAPVAVELLERGADATIGEKDGYTCAHGAGFQGRPDVVRALFPRFLGRVPLLAHADGFSPIHRACWGREARHADAVRAFIDVGAQAHNLRAGNDETPLDMALRVRNAATVKVLEDAGRAAGGGGLGGDL